MSEARATLSSYRQSPRKVRVVANLVRGKRVSDALTMLAFTTKRAANPLAKLMASAVANAKSLSMTTDNLVVKEMRVDGGKILYRRRPRSHGMANPIRKRTSHVTLVLSEGKPKKK
jgi:large subunit ribosomal protein L22